MKKRLIAALCAGAVAVTAVTGAVIYSNNYDVYTIVETAGVAVAGDDMLVNLTGEKVNTEAEEVKELESTAFEASETVYVRGGKLYLGENKVPLSSAYPFFVNDGSAVYCINGNTTAITEEFDYVSTYEGLYISNGISFNQDMERAYREDFLLLQLSNGLFLNSMELTLKKSDLPGVTLPGNSVISFFENELRYYSLDKDGMFRLTSVSGLTENSKIIINNVSYSYYDFLDRLGLYEVVEELVEITPEPTPTPTPIPTPTPAYRDRVTNTPAPTATPEPTPTPATSQDDNMGTGEGPTPEVYPSPGVGTADGTVATPTPQPKPTKEPSDKVRITPTPRPTLTPIPPMTAAPAEPGGTVEPEPGTQGSSPAAPAPAQPAAPEGAAPPAQPSPSKPSSPGATLWKKPEAELTGDFTALVYSVTHSSLKVTNAQFLHKSGIAFEVREADSGKLVGRKAYSDSTNDIRISGLEPGTKYKVSVIMNYVDAKGNKVSEAIREGDVVTTYGRDKLPPLDINWSNGQYLYTNKADINAIQIENQKENDPFYQDMILHIAKCGILFKQGFSKETFVLNQQNLTNIKNGMTVDYTTPERLKSNKEYTYTFSFTDKFGEEFQMVGTYQGTIRTAKKAPTASIKVTKNEIRDIEITISLANSDDAVMENTYFVVKNSTGTIIETTLYRDKKKTSETGVHHELTKDSTDIRFAELLDAESYTIEVYSDYDQADNHGMVLEQLIGSGKVITTSITSLGVATYNVSFPEIKSDSAIVYVKLDKSRTSSRLYGVIDQYDMVFEKITRNAEGEIISASSEDIRVDYIANETEVLTPEDEEEEVNIDDFDLYSDDLDSLDTTEDSVSENKITFTAEDGKLTLESYQLDMIHGDGMTFALSNLDSVTEYRITIVPKVHVGSATLGAVREIRTSYAPNSFTTLKREAYITMDSARVTANSIKLFDVSVVDKDNAILEYPLNVQVYDEKGVLVFREIYSEENLTGGNGIDIELLYLENNKEYTIRFTVSKYKEEVDSTDYVTSYELYYEPYKETKEPLKLTTGDDITGDIYLREITTGKVVGSKELEVSIGNDGFKIHAVQKHPDLAYSRNYGDINKVYINTRNPGTDLEFLRYRYEHGNKTELWAMVFKAEVDFGEDYYNSMSIGYGSVDPTTVRIRLYQEDPSANPNAVPLAETVKQSYNVTSNNLLFKWMDPVTFRDGITLTGKQTFYVEYMCMDEVLEPEPGKTDDDIENWGDLGVFCGVTFSNRMEVEDRNQYYYANVEVEVLDLAGQLGEEGTYYVQVYEDDKFIDMQKHVFTNYVVNGKKQVSIYDVTSSNDPNPVLLETITYEGEGLLCHFDYYYKIKRNGVAGHEYKFVLTAYPDKAGNEMDTLTFMSNKIATGIRRKEELTYLRWDPYGSYVVLEDIDMGTWKYGDIGMNDKVYFEGTLDFQGHTLTTNSDGSLIYYLGTEGVIENVVIHYGESYAGRSTGGTLVAGCYGTVRNVMVETIIDSISRWYPGKTGNHCGIVSTVYPGAVVENVVVHIPETFYCTSYTGMISYMNYGTIRNCYIYGAPISMVPYDYLTVTQKSSKEIYIAPICPNNRAGSIIENCYSLVDLYCNFEKDKTTATDVYNISIMGRESQGIVRNCFAVGSCYYMDKYNPGTYTILPKVNPMLRSVDAAKHTDLYFYSKESYDATGKAGAHMIDLTILHSDAWMENLLNSDSSSKSGQYDTSHVRHGYYPQLNLPSNMPAQALIALPDIGNASDNAILGATVLPETEDLSSGKGKVQAMLQVYFPTENPGDYKVTSVSVDDLDVRVVSYRKPSDQYYWEVVVELSNPTKCISKYPIKQVVFESNSGGADVVITDDAKTCKYINYAFYHPISTLEDWYKINSARGENYRLMNDLDFTYGDRKLAYIGNYTNPNMGSTVPGTDYAYKFTGVLDGNGYTIKNLDLRDRGGLFECLYGGTIKNLTIENLDITAKDAEAPVDMTRGFVRHLSMNGKLDNVHVLGGELTSTYVTGTLVGKLIGENRYGNIMNCSVHDVTITTTAKNNVNQQYVGGFIGQGTSKTTLTLQNCYADGLKIIAKDAFTIGGIGGFAGELFAGATMENLYLVDSSIDSYYKNIGGVVASLKTADNNYSSLYKLRKVYADIDITSTSDYLGGLVGFTTCRNVVDVVNALFLGNVVVTNESLEYVNRYDGGGKSVTTRTKNFYTLGTTSFVNGWLYEDVDTRMEEALEKLYEEEEDVTIKVIPEVSTSIDKGILSEASFYSTGVFLNGEWRNLNFTEGFVTDYETVEDGNTVVNPLVAEGYLPWLKTTDGTGLLPYQEKHAIDDTEVTITKVTATAFPNNNMMFQLNISVTHPAGTVIDGVEFDENLSVSDNLRKVEHSATETELIYDVTAKRYKDKFFIRELCYHTAEGQEASTELYMDTNVPALFKNIKNASEWDEYMSDHAMDGDNIRLTGDLDFSVVGYNHSNVIINQLIGGIAGKHATISGVTGDETMISKVLSRIYNVEFKDITLESTLTETKPSFGIVEQVMGVVQNFSLKNVSITTSYYARVAPFVVVNGKIKDGTIDGVFIDANKRYVFGNQETAATGGVAAYATKTAGFKNLTLTNFGVNGKARYYTGGVVGIMNGAVYFWNITMENFYVNGLQNVGGIAGNANKKDFGYTFGQVHVKDGTITGVNKVGGMLGAGSVDNRKNSANVTSWEQPENEILAEGMFVVGKKYIGGIVGAGGGVAKNVTVKNSSIYGSAYVGGIIGQGTALATHCVESTISSVFARTIDADGKLSATNDIYDAALGAKIAALKEGAGTENSREIARGAAAELLEVYKSTETQTGVYDGEQRNQYRYLPSVVKDDGSINGDSDAFMGGISGDASVTGSNTVVNCTVGSTTTKYVGGVSGRFGSNSAQVVTHSLNRYFRANNSQNTEVTGSVYVGGLAGYLNQENYGVTDCYSNATVRAVYQNTDNGKGISGRYAGGCFGGVNNGYNFRGLYFAGSVTADIHWAGGIVGQMSGSYGAETRKLLMLGTVKVGAADATSVSFIGNTTSGGNLPTNCYVYEGAKLIKGTNEQTAKDYYEANPNSYTRTVTAAELSDKEFYINSNGEAGKGLFNTTSYWLTSGLTNGYMPYVRYAGDPVNPTGTPQVRYQEGKTGAGYTWKTYKGGVPIPKGTSGQSTFTLRRTVAVKQLPEVTAYAVDVDKLNIEFSAVDTTATCTVKANGAVLAEGAIDCRAITLQYDFKTTLTVTVTDGTDTLEYEIAPVDVSRNVLVYENDYYYITGTGIEGSRATVYGNFVHLYKGKALAADGRIYDLKQGVSTGNFGGLGLMDTVTPLATFVQNGSRIALYQRYSVVNGEVRDGMRLYVEEGTLFAVDGGLTDTADSVLLRVSSTGDELTAVLGNNRKLVDLTGDTVVFPKDFDNKNISQMTNNYQSASTVVLVRYTDGGVVGFDYRTGDVLVDTGRSSGAKGTTDGANQDGSNLGVTAPKQYKEVQEFEETLMASGWSQANGSSAANGGSGSESGNTTVFENGSTENGISGISGSNTTSGTNGVAGDSTASGTNTESGENTESGDNTEGGTGTESGDNTVSGEDTGASENGEASGEVSGENDASGEDSGSGDGTEGDAALNGTEEESGKISGGTKENSGEAASSGNGEDTKYLNEFTDVRNNGNGYASGDRYVPFFDATLNEYVLYDEAELLTASAGTITSVNEKVKRSGHMIDRHIPYMSDLDQADDSNRNGIILMLLTVAGVALLLGILIYKHQNGGKANEED